jgi:hypothetical protein
MKPKTRTLTAAGVGAVGNLAAPAEVMMRRAPLSHVDRARRAKAASKPEASEPCLTTQQRVLSHRKSDFLDRQGSRMRLRSCGWLPSDGGDAQCHVGARDDRGHIRVGPAQRPAIRVGTRVHSVIEKL